MVNFLLERYASDDIIPKADRTLRHFLQTPRMIPVDYKILLTKQLFRCGLVHSESIRLVDYIEGLHESILSFFRTYWSEHPKADISQLSLHSMRVVKLTGHTNTGTL